MLKYGHPLYIGCYLLISDSVLHEDKYSKAYSEQKLEIIKWVYHRLRSQVHDNGAEESMSVSNDLNDISKF